MAFRSRTANRDGKEAQKQRVSMTRPMAKPLVSPSTAFSTATPPRKRDRELI